MNNGKVRIYELSKELNLDNRDILAVCDQLNINVKSHSSTISDAEAARIRSAAEKYTPSHSSSSKASMPTHSTNNSSRQAGPQPPIKKQQILEVRRHRPATEPPKRPEPQSVPPNASPNQPQTTAGQPPRSPVRPVTPNRPVKSPTADDLPPVMTSEEPIVAPPTPPVLEQVDAPQPPAPVEPPVAREVVSEAEPATDLVEPDFSEPQIEAEVKEPTIAPELTAPPARPVPKSAGAGQSTLVNRPVLKRRSEQGEAAAAGPSRAPVKTDRSERSDRERPERPDTNRSRPAVASSAASGDAATVAPPKRVIELRHKPVRPGVAREEGASDTSANPAFVPPTASVETELKRPTLPRPPKRGKAWDEEEEDQEATPKAGKAGAKAKRRTQLLDDEDIELDDVLNADDGDDQAPIQVSLSLARPPRPKNKPAQVKQPAAVTQKGRKTSGSNDRNFRRDRREPEVKERPTTVSLTGSLSLHDLAEILVVPETEIIKTLFFKGIAANINQILDIPTAAMVAQEFDIEVETVEAEAEAKKVTEMLDVEDLENLQRRPPVVTIMGHVDHGKTTLLDSIRKTKVAQGEAGGITQHIGAYHVDVEHDDKKEQVVFLDTPGHEAFTAMRARGARVTDIAVLVVAADDGVRPQTIEAVSHAKAAGVPIVVAINKVDKEEAQPDRVKQELTEYGLVAEEWGGDTIMVPVSALTGENLDTLLEMLLLVAEVEDLHANPDRLARGTIIEANLDKARGPVATLLIQNGTLRVGDIIVAGPVFGKVRAMIDDRGQRVKEATPSFAVEVLGLSDVPAAGDEFEVYADEKEARAIANSRSDQQRQSRLQQAMASRRVSLNTLSAQAQEGELKELNLILKADVQGSVEAILAALQQLPQKEVQVRVLLAAPGEITETDVDLAAASNAVIIGFNTTFASGARQAADEVGVDVRDYNIIYKLLEDVQGAMEGLLEPELVEEPLGQVEVRATFTLGRGTVAGCYVLSGKAIRNCRIRVRRGGEVVYEGNLDSLKRMKDDVKEVNAGFECGIRVDGFSNWAEGDIIETFRLVTKRRTLSA
ncbi:translation initiation factor IF-2 [Oscillatoria sp. FACHB-1407]|uniref:translation initiation factor IF-2 n=1 Tax=Oscillatoria sp. FACHB-1407 TaxID=2692847 RepID=UPI0016847C9B|nr:translation initiation factor IF-2 [Oscillatoria sp. FACHB-1407]MBD2460720.1 translation initiation factor IF-2 [Oscillatoria sp. FACHB-1407]